MTAFTEVADGVHVLRYPVLDVNVTLVVGGETALLVDTLSSDAQAGELCDALRRVTALPLTVVNTHHHFDHCFGNRVVAGADTPVWAHEEAARELRENADRLQRDWYTECLATDPELANALATVEVRPPDRTVRTEASIDLGGRSVVLCHFGRGHTAGDLVVHVPDTDTILAGDLVEESGPPMFNDGYPLEWPETVAALLRLAAPSTVVVPGHGRLVDTGYVAAQHAELAALEWLIREGHADGAPIVQVAAKAPFGPEQSLVAVRRGYAELSGRV